MTSRQAKQRMARNRQPAAMAEVLGLTSFGVRSFNICPGRAPLIRDLISALTQAVSAPLEVEFLAAPTDLVTKLDERLV